MWLLFLIFSGFEKLGNLIKYGTKRSSEGFPADAPAAAGSLLKGKAVHLEFEKITVGCIGVREATDFFQSVSVSVPVPVSRKQVS